MVKTSHGRSHPASSEYFAKANGSKSFSQSKYSRATRVVEDLLKPLFAVTIQQNPRTCDCERDAANEQLHTNYSVQSSSLCRRYRLRGLGSYQGY